MSAIKEKLHDEIERGMREAEKVNSLIKYIESLESDSFVGWTADEVKGYLTACKSIKEKAKE